MATGVPDRSETGGGGGWGWVEKASTWNVAALMKSSHGPILLFLPDRDLRCPPSCSYLHVCHSEDAALKKIIQKKSLSVGCRQTRLKQFRSPFRKCHEGD